MKNANQPAFPISDDIIEKCGEKPNPFGLSKRERIAIAALQGILSNPTRSIVGENPAKDAVLYADSLLKELENGK